MLYTNRTAAPCTANSFPRSGCSNTGSFFIFYFLKWTDFTHFYPLNDGGGTPVADFPHHSPDFHGALTPAAKLPFLLAPASKRMVKTRLTRLALFFWGSAFNPDVCLLATLASVDLLVRLVGGNWSIFRRAFLFLFPPLSASKLGWIEKWSGSVKCRR